MDVGDYVRIVWLDHSSRDEWHTVGGASYDPVTFETFGRIVEIDQSKIVVASTLDTVNCDYVGHVTIILRAVVRTMEIITWH